MRLKKFLQNNNDYPYMSSLLMIMEHSSINEKILPDTLFNYLKTVGAKMGFNVKRSDSIFDYVAKAEEGIVDLFTFATLYFFSQDAEQKKELYQDMKDIMAKLDAREITAFLMQLDRATLGISAHVRHVLMSLFGVEITTYNNVMSELEWITGEIRKIRQALTKMDANPKMFKALENFEFALTNITEDGEGGGMTGGGIVTGDIAKFDKKLPGGMFRRKKKKGLRRLM